MEVPTSGPDPAVNAWLSLRDLGFSVFPLRPRCKLPQTPWKKYQTAPASRQQVLNWSQDPALNIGIVTGAISGIVVLDLDNDQALQEAERRGLPDTVRVRTPRGHHLYFRHPAQEVCNRAGVFPGADIRGDGGYVVAPGSTYAPDAKELAEGKVAGNYTWAHSPDEVAIATMPEWLLHLVAPALNPASTLDRVMSPAPETLWGRAALAKELGQLASVPEGTRNDALNRAAFKLFQIVASGNLDEKLVRDELMAAGLNLGLSLPEVEATLASASSAGVARPRGPKDRALPPQGSRPVEFTEDYIACEFARLHGEQWRYVALWGQWLNWNGTVWQRDQSLQVQALIRLICRELAVRAPDGKLATRLSTAAVMSAAERLARSDPVHASTTDVWDRDPWLLNTRGGIADLRIGAVRAHDSGCFMTRVAGAAVGGGCPTWLQFLDTVTGREPELQAYLQRMAGYCLTGVTSEHALFFLYGTGANGKSVFAGTLAEVLGDYTAVAPMDMFMASQGDRHPTDMAGLRGARMVTSIETEQGSRWAESKLKALTGGDKITARFMRQDFFDYTPQFKLVIVGNHKPSIRNVDEAMRRRLHMIPFTVTIPPEKRDKSLPQRLLGERDGILAWALQGCLEWQRIGLKPPVSVLAATEDYFDAEDAVGRWMQERCERAPNLKNSSRCLYDDWKSWAEQNGEFVGSIRRLSDALTSRGFARHNTREGKGFAGIAVRSGRPDGEGV